MNKLKTHQKLFIFFLILSIIGLVETLTKSDGGYLGILNYAVVRYFPLNSFYILVSQIIAIVAYLTLLWIGITLYLLFITLRNRYKKTQVYNMPNTPEQDENEALVEWLKDAEQIK